ncbi:acyltransferase [Candidatus Marinimicrobia bacterium]|nr:acyltransferase [Candidatus Neomarinimicrobiota bacterium]
MDQSEKIIIENQLRKHHTLTIIGWFRRIRALAKCQSTGKNIIVDANVKLLRFPQKISIGHQVIIKEGTRICPTNENASITIGDRTTIGYHTMIFSSINISIGDDCLIAPFCYLIDSNHQINKNIKINEQAIEAESIEIQNDVWLGTGVKILSGVTIGEGSVIAAGSVVNQDVPPYTIFGGTPARQIGERI